MSFTDRPIRNLLLPLLTLLVALWLKPIVQRIPAPKLPKVQLKSLNGTAQKTDSCKIINSSTSPLKYCEDILHWREANLAIVSCDEGRPEWNTVIGPLKNPDPRGKLFAYNTAEIDSSPNAYSHSQIYQLDLVDFPITKDFHPLGLQLHSFNHHSARLFVVNHRRDRSVIEVFKLQLVESPESKNTASPTLSATWERSLAHDLISTPNSIVSMNPNTLLVTNDHYFNRRTNPLLHTLETFLGLMTGNVIEVRFIDRDSDEFGELGDKDVSELKNVEAWSMLDWIPFANGLTLSPDKSTLVVASTMAHGLWYYNRHSPIGQKKRLGYTPTGSRRLSFAPDNVRFDGADRLIVAGHPHGLTLLKFSQNVLDAKPAGSIVAIVSHTSGPDLSPHATRVHEIFVDDGDFFASSTGAIILPQSDHLKSKDLSDSHHPERKMIVTGLYQPGLLQCHLS